MDTSASRYAMDYRLTQASVQGTCTRLTLGPPDASRHSTPGRDSLRSAALPVASTSLTRHGDLKARLKACRMPTWWPCKSVWCNWAQRRRLCLFVAPISRVKRALNGVAASNVTSRAPSPSKRLPSTCLEECVNVLDGFLTNIIEKKKRGTSTRTRVAARPKQAESQTDAKEAPEGTAARDRKRSSFLSSLPFPPLTHMLCFFSDLGWIP